MYCNYRLAFEDAKGCFEKDRAKFKARKSELEKKIEQTRARTKGRHEKEHQRTFEIYDKSKCRRRIETPPVSRAVLESVREQVNGESSLKTKVVRCSKRLLVRGTLIGKNNS